MTSIAKWTPRIPILPKNNIISSDYTNTKPFVPDYSNDPEDMQLIMANAYAKKWHNEKSAFKKRIEQEKIENEVFLMRRYVIKGYNQKMKALTALPAVASRVQIGKKVPYAVRLRPPTEKSKPSSHQSSKQVSRKPSKSSLKLKKSEQKLGRHVSIEDTRARKCAEESDDTDLKEVEAACNHVHVERKGNKFVVHRVQCEKNHHHGCDCTEFDPEEPSCRGSYLD